MKPFLIAVGIVLFSILLYSVWVTDKGAQIEIGLL
jgi:hypothetical protein